MNAEEIRAQQRDNAGKRECTRHGLSWFYNWETKEPDTTGACGHCYRELFVDKTHFACGEHGIEPKSESGGCSRCEAVVRAVENRSRSGSAQGAPPLESVGGGEVVGGRLRLSGEDPGPAAVEAGGDGRRNASGAPALHPAGDRGDGARGIDGSSPPVREARPAKPGVAR